MSSSLTATPVGTAVGEGELDLLMTVTVCTCRRCRAGEALVGVGPV